MSSIEDKRKNIITLLDAYQMIRKKHPKCVLSLIGQCFSLKDPIVRRLKENGKLEGVKLMGAIPHEEVIEYLRSVDLMIHPSLEETFGNTLIEAMATGCPVLGGEKSGAVPYVLDFGKAGYLCDVTSSESISEKVDEIINNPYERRVISHYAQSRCANEYSSKIIAQKYIELFNKAIEETC